MKNARTLVPIICVLIGLGVGFLGGFEYRNYRLNQTRGNFATGSANGAFQRFNGTKGAGQNGMMNRGGAVTGSILSVDDMLITVKLNDGSTKIVLFSGSTTYSNTVASAKSDLKVGSEVAVFGAPNSDGSVTATNVQINPTSLRPQGSPSPTP